MTFTPRTEEFIADHLEDDVQHLALGKHPDGVDMQAALTQIAGFQRAGRKLPQWAAVKGICWPRQLPLEQCTGQQLAVFKSGLVKGLLSPGFSMADLTGGFGVDFHYLSSDAGVAHYNELDSGLCLLAEHNMRLLGHDNCIVTNGSAEDFLLRHRSGHFGLIYIDPARRSQSGRKLVSLKDCSPDVTLLQDSMLGISDYVIVKMSPMLDISVVMSQLRCMERLYVLSSQGECRELLAVMRQGFAGDTVISAVDVDEDGKAGALLSATYGEESELPLPLCSPDSLVPGTFLYEPNAACMKSGLYRRLCAVYGVRQLHVNSHLYVSDSEVAGFPGRKFRVTESVRYDRRSAGLFFRMHAKANVSVRNFPMPVKELQRRFRITDGGDDYVFATTAAPDVKMLVSASRI